VRTRSECPGGRQERDERSGEGSEGGEGGTVSALTPAAAATDGDGRRARGVDARQLYKEKVFRDIPEFGPLKSLVECHPSPPRMAQMLVEISGLP